MKCPACGKANPPGNPFCRHCGTRLVQVNKPASLVCARCGTANQPGRKFCRKCGAPLSTAQPPPESPTAAEARQGESTLAAALQSADQTLRQVGATTPPITAAMNAVKARLDAGRRALAAQDFDRAHHLLTGSFARSEVEELNRQIAAFQEDRKRKAQQHAHLDSRRAELETRMRAAAANLTGLRVDISAANRKLIDLGAQLKAGDAARRRGDLAAFAQALDAVGPALDTLEQEDIPRLRQNDQLRQEIGQQGEAALVAAAQAAEQALRQPTLADTAAATAALRAVKSRLDAGRQALAAGDLDRARTLLTGSFAQADVDELRRQIAVLQDGQQRLERLRSDLDHRRQELEARVKAVEASIGGLRVDTAAIRRQLSDLRARLKAGDGARKRGNLAAAQQSLDTVQTALDTLEGTVIPRLLRDDEERQRRSQELVQRSAALSAAAQELRGKLSALPRVELGEVETGLQAVEQTVRAGLAAHRAGNYVQAAQQFDAGERAVSPLQQQVTTLQERERHLDELIDRLQQRRQEFEVLQARLALLDDPALADEARAVEQAVTLLTDVDTGRRWPSAEPLETLLARAGDPEQVRGRVAARLGAPAPLARPAAAEEIAGQISDLQLSMETLDDTLADAERQGLLVAAERKMLENLRAALERAQAAGERAAWEEAWRCLAPFDRRQLAELREGLERRIALAASLQLKTTLSLSRVPEKAEVTRYNVILNISGTGWGDAGSIKGDIKVGYKDRVDMRQAIDDLTTVINLLFGAQGSLRGRRPDLKESAAIESLSDLGDMMYGLFLPVSIQEHIREAQTSILLATDDLELPWELLHTGKDFLCLNNPVGRMPIMERFPRRNEYTRGDPLRFLFIANPTGDLPASEQEVEHIAGGLQDADVTIWKGAQVTNLKLHQALRSGEYDVIHYSGHAFYNPQTPNESGLVLSDQSIFIADSIQRMLRGRPLIFLNACESGREMMKDGEVTYTGSEGEGLALSFVLGGALGFIGTLWPVFDEGAAEFAAAFYQHMMGGEMIGEALRQARLTVRQARPTDVTWASFILYGDPTLRMREADGN